MKVNVRTSTSAIARLTGTQKVAATVGIQGPAGLSVASMSDLSDIDITTLTDGCVLVWSTATNKWVAQTLLNTQQIDMGSESY